MCSGRGMSLRVLFVCGVFVVFYACITPVLRLYCVCIACVSRIARVSVSYVCVLSVLRVCSWMFAFCGCVGMCCK